MKQLCYSKKLVLVSWVTTALLTAITVVGALFLERDITPLLTVAGLSWAETATSTGFYYWKARTENKIKLTKDMVESWADKYGIEAATSLIGIVLSE